jgi:NAD(P)-dependent dehydrogenase (short-subunit alcohol dehydrogenase family)
VSRSDFSGDIAVVTGAARGLGQAVARLFASRGATVVVGDVDETGATACAEALRGDGLLAHAVAVDVTDEASVAAFAQRVRDEVGRPGLLVNNVGYYAAQPVREIRAADFHRVMALNLTSVFLVTQALLDDLISAEHARVVNVASNDAYVPKVRMAHYAAAKAGVVSLTKTFAEELAGHDVLVNGVSPGAIATETAKSQGWLPTRIASIPLQRAAEPEDIAEVIAFLASRENRFMTGETVIANGGYLMV